MEVWEIDFDDILGYGNYGTVYSCYRNDDDRSYAIKIFKSDFASLNEIEILNYLKEFQFNYVGNIVDCFDVNNRTAIVMEKLEGGEVFDRIINDGHFSEHKAAKCLLNLVHALIDLNRTASILHRDVKPENLVFVSNSPDSEVKLIDFGLAIKATDDQISDGIRIGKKPAGTGSYMAPEIIKSCCYSAKSDVWSAGVTLYALLSGTSPFDQNNKMLQRRQILEGKYNPMTSAEWDGISDDAKDLIRKMLTVDPIARISLHEILRHPWIVNTVSSTILEEEERHFNEAYFEQMKKLKARYNFKKVVNAALLTVKLRRSALRQLKEQEQNLMYGDTESETIENFPAKRHNTFGSKRDVLADLHRKQSMSSLNSDANSKNKKINLSMSSSYRNIPVLRTHSVSMDSPRSTVSNSNVPVSPVITPTPALSLKLPTQYFKPPLPPKSENEQSVLSRTPTSYTSRKPSHIDSMVDDIDNLETGDVFAQLSIQDDKSLMNRNSYDTDAMTDSVNNDPTSMSAPISSHKMDFTPEQLKELKERFIQAANECSQRLQLNKSFNFGNNYSYNNFYSASNSIYFNSSMTNINPNSSWRVRSKPIGGVPRTFSTISSSNINNIENKIRTKTVSFRESNPRESNPRPISNEYSSKSRTLERIDSGVELDTHVVSTPRLKKKMDSEVSMMDLENGLDGDGRENEIVRITDSNIDSIFNFNEASTSSEVHRDGSSVSSSNNSTNSTLSRASTTGFSGITGITGVSGSESLLTIDFQSFQDIMFDVRMASLAQPHIFHIFDTNGDGLINYHDFITTLSAFKHCNSNNPNECDKSTLKLYFDLFDIEGKGEITFDELRFVLASLLHDDSDLCEHDSHEYNSHPSWTTLNTNNYENYMGHPKYPQAVSQEAGEVNDKPTLIIPSNYSNNSNTIISSPNDFSGVISNVLSSPSTISSASVSPANSSKDNSYHTLKNPSSLSSSDYYHAKVSPNHIKNTTNSIEKGHIFAFTSRLQEYCQHSNSHLSDSGKISSISSINSDLEIGKYSDDLTDSPVDFTNDENRGGKSVEDLFQEMDTNRDGKITFDEFCDWFQNDFSRLQTMLGDVMESPN